MFAKAKPINVTVILPARVTEAPSERLRDEAYISSAGCFISIMRALISFSAGQSPEAIFKSAVLVLSLWRRLVQTRARNCFMRIKWD